MIETALAAPLPDAGTANPSIARQLRMGLEHLATGRIDEAIDAFQRGLAAVGNEPCGGVSTETVSELHSKLASGRSRTCCPNYKAALRLAPHLTFCWCNLGNVYLKSGKPEDAIALYVQALTLNPGHWSTRTNLVQALMTTQQHLLVMMLLAELVEERPNDSQIRNQLGRLHFELGELETALQCFRRAVVLNPSDSESIYWIGGINQRMGEAQAAEAAYAEAVQLQPLIRRPAARSPGEFRALALFAPCAGNVPTGYLFKDTVYDTDTLAVFASSKYDVELLKQGVQVVVNLISDADHAEPLLPLSADLVDRFGRPVVNDPRKIRRTTRDAVTVLLRGIPGCRIPEVLRQKAGTDLEIATLRAALAVSPAVLSRPVGTHGGDDFEKIEGSAVLAAALAQPPGTGRYFIEYVDYRSRDGLFRKYRSFSSMSDSPRLEGASRQHGHGGSPMEAAGRISVPERSRHGFRCRSLSDIAGNSAANRP